MPISLVLHLVVAYVLYMLLRVAYLLENWGVLGGAVTDGDIRNMLTGSWMFDTSAIMYSNALVVLMIIIPYSNKVKRPLVTWTFTIINAIAVVMNLADAVYFRYTSRRTTGSVFKEFQNEDNLGSIFGVELLRHWYLVALGVLLIVGIFYASRWIMRRFAQVDFMQLSLKAKLMRCLGSLVVLLVFVPFCIAGMRGGFSHAIRPITVSNANQYVTHPQDAALVLNTPFSLMRTYDIQNFEDPKYLSDNEMDALFSPTHKPTTLPDSIITGKGKNIVVLIVESFGREYIGAYNHDLDGGRYKGYTPEMDEIIEKSLTFEYTFCNGRKSIDAMPSILSSIPMFVEPFFLTPSSMNDVSGIAGELGKIGYYSAFFHGAENGSMGFEAFAKKTGFKDYFGRTEFEEDKRFGGEKEFDGTWAIWDEPFLQFYAEKMTEMKQPFVTAVFTASSHHPFAIPAKYESEYKNDGPNPIHRCIRYTDHALGEFFRTASKQPWFKNTIFVLTSDHTNGQDHKEYKTDLGLFCGPIFIYDPSGNIKPGIRNEIAQQIDIMPTLLSAVGYPKPYVGFGTDLLTTPAKDTWTVNYLNGIYQYVKGDYIVQFDGQKLTGMYNYKKDRLMQHNLLNTGLPEQKQMEKEVKAVIQSYMQRMENNKLVI